MSICIKAQVIKIAWGSIPFPQRTEKATAIGKEVADVKHIN